jgi:hypothetical protein
MERTDSCCFCFKDLSSASSLSASKISNFASQKLKVLQSEQFENAYEHNQVTISNLSRAAANMEIKKKKTF